jgi:hypothetical protein
VVPTPRVGVGVVPTRECRTRRGGGSAGRQRAKREARRQVQELLGQYSDELRATGQDREAERVLGLADDPRRHFLMSVPEREQTDPSISTV